MTQLMRTRHGQAPPFFIGAEIQWNIDQIYFLLRAAESGMSHIAPVVVLVAVVHRNCTPTSPPPVNQIILCFHDGSAALALVSVLLCSAGFTLCFPRWSMPIGTFGNFWANERWATYFSRFVQLFPLFPRIPYTVWTTSKSGKICWSKSKKSKCMFEVDWVSNGPVSILEKNIATPLSFEVWKRLWSSVWMEKSTLGSVGWTHHSFPTWNPYVPNKSKRFSPFWKGRKRRKTRQRPLILAFARCVDTIPLLPASLGASFRALYTSSVDEA